MKRFSTERMFGVMTWVLSLLFLCTGVAWAQAESGLVVSGGTLNKDYTYADNVYTVKTGTSLTFSGETTTDRIVIAEGVAANVTLDGASIAFSDGEGDHKEIGTCAIEIKNRAAVTLTISATNSLQSGASKAAIQVEKGASIQIEGDGTLTAQGGWGGAGIGAGDGTSCGTIRIKSGTVNAYAGDWAFGLGGGCFLDMETYKEGIIIIDGGNVTAGGKEWGSSSMMGNITLNGGNITTSYHYKTPTYQANAAGNITVNNSFTSTIKNWTIKGSGVVKRGAFTGCTFTGGMTLEDGTFTNCTFSGEKFVMYKGSINNTDGSRITSKEIVINGGEVTVEIPDANSANAIGNQDCNVTINGGTVRATAKAIAENGDPSGAGIAGTVTINGGHVIAKSKGCNGAGIGGYGSSHNGITVNSPITIRGGIVEAEGISHPWNDYTTIGIGTINNTNTAGTITIEGGVIKTNGIGCNKGGVSTQVIIKGGSIIGEIKNITPKDGEGNEIYLGITPVIENATDVSVDDQPYYISGNHTDDNKLYLYMTGKNHTVTIRTSDGRVTTYTATYVDTGVDGNTNNGFFSFTDESITTPTAKSSVSIKLEQNRVIYTQAENILTVTLPVIVKKETTTLLRSAAMHSVRLVLTDGDGKTHYSDRQTVTESNDYTFKFDTKGLDAGNYTLTAQYGGSATSLASDEATATLIIEQAEGITAPDYDEPENLTAIYGQTLADVNLPATWMWNAITSVDNAGEQKHMATFTSSDAKNYKTVEKKLAINVAKKMVTEAPADPTALDAITYNPKTTLANIKLDNGWKWADGATIPTSTTTEYPAYYKVTDDTNYDWSGISGYNSNNHRVERNIALTVNKASLTSGNFSFIYEGGVVKVEYAGTGTIGAITVYYSSDNGSTYTTDAPTAFGTYKVYIDVAESDNYEAIVKLTDKGWTFTIAPVHSIIIDPNIQHGSVAADKQNAQEGETVTLTVTPDGGYELESLSYTAGTGQGAVPIRTTFNMPAADVTITATFKPKTVTPPIDPEEPENPDPDPAPEPTVYYTVTLPVVEGAATDPAAGSYEVEAWNSFGFFLTLADDYNLSVPVVTTDSGETLEPRRSDGKYILRYVRRDTGIRISGIVKNPDPVANEAIEANTVQVRGGEGCLLLRLGTAQKVNVYTFTGSLFRRDEAPVGDTRWSLPAGNYIVLVDGKTYKVSVR